MFKMSIFSFDPRRKSFSFILLAWLAELKYMYIYINPQNIMVFRYIARLHVERATTKNVSYH